MGGRIGKQTDHNHDCGRQDEEDESDVHVVYFRDVHGSKIDFAAVWFFVEKLEDKSENSNTHASHQPPKRALQHPQHIKSLKKGIFHKKTPTFSLARGHKIDMQ